MGMAQHLATYFHEVLNLQAHCVLEIVNKGTHADLIYHGKCCYQEKYADNMMKITIIMIHRTIVCCLMGYFSHIMRLIKLIFLF